MSFLARNPLASALSLLLLVYGSLLTYAKDCPSLTPPLNGILKCQKANGKLQCMATCYQGHLFDTQEPVVIRNCDHVTGHWQEGDFIPICSDKCADSLLSGPVADKLQPVVEASTDASTGSAQPLSQRVLLGTKGHWQPTKDDLAQFVQVKFSSSVRINGVVVRGDLSENYVTAFRVLLSQDGRRWFPYTDGQGTDKIFPGNTNSKDQTTIMFECPHEARFIRINPITWVGHPALAIDVLGCPLQAERLCKPLEPPQGGAVTCEINGDKMMCTAYCLGDAAFPDGELVLSHACYENIGQFSGSYFPRCVGEGSVKPPQVNVSGFCMEQEIDCEHIENGDYQYCGDCHYFSTCSHGFLYIRACPALLKFDATNGLCDYHSNTCQSKHRRFWLAERRVDTYWEKFT